MNGVCSPNMELWLVGLDTVKGRAISWAAVAKVIKGNGDRAY